ncbi:MAG: peptidoglycan DD-metalloendopeptidase family protein, partial [Lactobacillus sp.]|nr:peptidoglycan DD-metalloendopeptidase family protein [Lactobacillus sp.]
AEKKALEEQQAMESKKLEEIKRADLIKLKPPIINDIGEEFIKAKGKLLMPARGSVVTKFNEEMSKGVKSKGVVVKTRNMAQVVSPFDGSVMFAAPFRGYGNTIIIDHGKGYLSLLAGMESVDCEPGQMLLAGEPIGQMPNDANAKLYIEIRKDSNPLDPMRWIEKN